MAKSVVRIQVSPPKFGMDIRIIEQLYEETLRAVGYELLRRGYEDMLNAGNFGSQRWQTSLRMSLEPNVLTVTNIVPFSAIFEYGGDIKAKSGGKDENFLWIPIDKDIKVRARDFGEPLFKVVRKKDGLPLLLSSADRQVKYFGKKEVHMPQKFHLRDIAKELAETEFPRTFDTKMLAAGLGIA
jgi:hypothetical protein